MSARAAWWIRCREDAPWFVRDYHDYYKTPRGYHPRSGNSTDGRNITGTMSFLNQPILAYASERSRAPSWCSTATRRTLAIWVRMRLRSSGVITRSLCSCRALYTPTFTTGGGKDAILLGYVAGVLREVSGIGAGRRIEFPALRRGSRLLWRPAIPTARGCAARTRPQPGEKT